MKYVNSKTGIVIDVPCFVSGGDWTAFETKEIEEISEAPEVKEVEEVDGEEIEGIEGISVKEIKQELDAFGIKYNPKAKKQELYNLMIKGK